MYIFTKNYDNSMLADMGYFLSANNTLDEAHYLLDNNIVSKKFNAGNSTSSSYYYCKSMRPVDQGGGNSAYIWTAPHSWTVGDGSGTPTYYDYQLFGNIVWSFMDIQGSSTVYNNYSLKTAVQPQVTALTENSKEYIKLTLQLRNDGASNVTIGEVAIAPRCGDGTSGISSGNRFLFFHDVFTPVTVGPGEYWSYECKVEIPSRPNKPSA